MHKNAIILKFTANSYLHLRTKSVYIINRRNNKMEKVKAYAKSLNNEALIAALKEIKARKFSIENSIVLNAISTEIFNRKLEVA